MAYRDRTTSQKIDSFDYVVVEVRLRKQGTPAATKDEVRMMIVDNHLETLGFVRHNMKKCVANIIRTRLDKKESV
jgi:hypothetical protein